MTKLLVALLSLLLLGTAPLQQFVLRENNNLVLAVEDVNLIPLTSERILQHQTILVQNGVIIHVGPAASAAIPSNAVRISGRNQYLIPGLADMHVHLHTMSDLLLWMVNGVTVLRNMRGTPLHLAWRDRIERGEMLGPDIYSAGSILDGYPPTGDSVTVLENPAAVEPIVRRQKEAGFHFLKVYNRLTPEVYSELVRWSRHYQIPVVGHVPIEPGIEAAFAGHASIEHLTGYMKEVKNIKGGVDERSIERIAQQTSRAGVWNCVTLVVQKKLIDAENASQIFKRDEIQYVSPIRAAMWAPSRIRRFQALDADDFQAARRGFDVLKQIVNTLKNKKAKILTGTDAPSYFVVPGFSIHEELQYLVESGLSPYQALRASTISAAEFLGAQSRFGTIGTGMRADLVMLKGNPLKDISQTRRISGVMVRGQWIDENQIREILRTVKASYEIPKNSFAKFPRISGKTPLRYVIYTGDIAIGEERISRTDDGTYHAQQVSYPPFDSAYSVQLKKGSGGITISMVSTRFEGEGKIDGSVHDSKVILRGALPYQPEFGEIERAADLLVPGNSVLAPLALPHTELESVAVGESKEFRLEEMIYGIFANQNFEVKTGTWNLRRYEDKTEIVDSSAIPVRVFSGAAFYGKERRRIVFALDAEGIPVIYSRSGLTFKRIE